MDAGQVEIDFDLYFPRLDLRPESPEWEARTWHEIRNRISRLFYTEGTSINGAHRRAQKREAGTDVRGRTPSSPDSARGSSGIRS